MGAGAGSPGVWTLLRDVGIFAAVLLAAWWSSRALARQARGIPGSPRAFTVLGALQLGQGRQVCAVHFAGRVLVLGMGDKQIALLEAIRDPEEVARLMAPTGTPGPSGFGPAMARALGRRRRRGDGPDA